MTPATWILLASFATPLRIDTTAASMLWLLPLVASLAVVYKATKVDNIRWKAFLRETTVLFGSILVFILVATLVIQAVAWFVTEQLPNLLGGPSF
jgi:hypothetical protein